MLSYLGISSQRNINPFSCQCCQQNLQKVALLVSSLFFACAAIAAHFGGLGLPGIVAFSIASGLGLSILVAICIYQSGKAKYYLIGAKLGSAHAQYQLARRFESGDGVRKDIDQAFNWYQKAAIQGHSQALNQVAFLILTILEEGDVRVDKEQAFELLIKAAENKELNDIGFYLLAYCYEHSIHFDKDVDKAKELYKQAAQKGSIKAMYRLGVLFAKEETEQEKITAVEWLFLACERGNDEALELIRSMAEDGIVPAQVNLGVILLDQEKQKEAIDWFSKAAEQNDANAQYNLGVILEEQGEKKKAIEWYKKAADQGHKDAQMILDEEKVNYH